MPPDRRSSRILAMQALTQWEVQGPLDDAALFELFTDLDADLAVTGYAIELFRTVLREQERIDRDLAATAASWELKRMSPVERNAMRVALAEMGDVAVPPKVAINEAIEIVREFGGKESPRFVNGVLDEVYRKMREVLG